MSIDVMNRLWWREDLPMTEKFIALALADSSNDDGVSWPAVDTVAQKCSCSARTVQNAVKGLCDKGLLRKMERKDRSNYYVFNLSALPHCERVRRRKESFDGHERTTGAGDSPQLFDTGESGSMTGESGSMTGESPAPRTIIEPSIESPDSDSGDFKSPDVSLTNFVHTEWDALKDEFPSIAGIRKIDDSLAKQIQLRGRQHAKPGEDPMAVWRTVFQEIRASQFLTGRVPPGPGRDTTFKLSLGWVCQTQKFREVINGKYSSDRGTSRAFNPATGERLGPTGQAVRGTVERMRAARQRSGAGGDR
jgi:hypothetical protein